ncbi:winged helix-turn-helix domain-containing protein [Marinicella sp. W31]|uniref:winged helix-turn-helix domain-containing protein n=1 Tax=Marinicella sp. W31 TaxID=3023713 RepID=UPI0037564893
MNYMIGDWQVLSSENKLIHTSNQTLIHLEPKSMAVLNYFAQNPGEVISIDDLIREVWMDRVVGNHAVYRVINQLRKNLNAEDKNAYLVNIPKKGYQLIQPVELSSLPQDNEPEIEQHSQARKILFPYLVLMAAGFLGLAWWFFTTTDSEISPSLYYSQTKPITSAIGHEIDPQFSIDGQYMAYSKQANKSDPFNVFLLNLKNNEEVQITDSETDALQPVVSESAERMVYINRDKALCSVMLVDQPLNKASKNKVSKESKLFDCDWQNMDLALSNDGKTLFYTKVSLPNNQHKIFALSIETGKTIQLTTIKTVNSQGDRVISLSPDNKKLAFLRDTDWKWSILGILDTTDYKETLYIKTDGWLNGLAWTPDSDNIIYQDSYRSLSLFSPISGKTQKITSGFTEDILNISHNGIDSRLAITFGSKQGGILIHENPLFVGLDKPFMHSAMIQSTEVDFFPSFARQSNDLAFMSKRTGSSQIWLQAEEGETTQISAFDDRRNVRTIRWSPNDAFLLTETEDSISYLDVNDKTTHTVIAKGTFGSVGGSTWNQEGTGVYFSSDISGDNQIYLFDIAKESTQQVTSKGGVMAFSSEDEDWLYLLKSHHDGLWKFNQETGEEILLVEAIDSGMHRSINITDEGVYYVSEKGLINFYRFASQKNTVLNIGMELIVPVLSVSHDEAHLAFPYYDKKETSIFLLSN